MSSSINLTPLTTKHKRNLLDPCIENPFFRIASTGDANPSRKISKQRSDDIHQQIHKGSFELQPTNGLSKGRKRKVNIITYKDCSNNNINPIHINKESVKAIDDSKLNLIDKGIGINGKPTIRETASCKSKSNFKLNMIDMSAYKEHQSQMKQALTSRKLTEENTQQISKMIHPISAPHKHGPKPFRGMSVDRQKKETKKKPNGALDCLLETQHTKRVSKTKKRGLTKHKSLSKVRNISVSKASSSKDQINKIESQPENLTTAKLEQTGNIEPIISTPIENPNLSSQNLLASKSVIAIAESNIYVQPIDTQNKKPIRKGQFSFCSLFACVSLGSKN